MKYIILLILLFSVNLQAQFIGTNMFSRTVDSPLLDSLFAYYSLDESSGDAIDLVNGGANDLSLSGTVTQNQAGKVGTAYSFATDGNMNGATTDFQLANSFSLSFWVSTTEDGGAGDVLMSTFIASNYGWEVWSLGTGTRMIRFRMRYNGGDTYIESTTDVNDGAWYHGVVSYNHVDDTMKVYINGVLEDSDKNTNGVWYHATSLLDVGHRLTQYDFEGKLDEVAIYRGLELTHAQVLELYNSGSGLAYPLDY